MTRRQRWRCIAVAALLLAGWLGASAGWIHAKAALAQVLLQRAWAHSDHGRQPRRPWPWADMTPVARLRIPRLGKSLIVLGNDSGQALAFGPGWTPRGRAPGAPGLTVISAHRDTQFAFLRRLHRGDVVTLDSAAGLRHYRVGGAQIVDSRQVRPGADDADALLLVTCYPFDAIMPGGPLRYVVEAWPMAPAPVTAQPIAARMASISAR